MAILLSLILGVLPAFFYALIIYWLDRYEKEPLLLLGAVFIWGAVFAAGGAFILNTTFGIGVFLLTGSEGTTELATGSVSAPLVEESLKGLAVLIVFLLFRKEFDSLLDGVVYAGVTALGFAATENSFYIWQFGASEGGLSEILLIAFVRNVLVGWQHPFYTAFIGIGLAVTRTTRSALLKGAAPILGWGAAVVTHSIHNTLATVVGGLGGLALGTLLDWTGWLFMFILIIWFIAREQNYLRHYLAEEVKLEVLSQEQYRTACSALTASVARFNALFSGRYLATNRFYQLCAELAHKKLHLHRLGEQSASADIDLLRKEISQLASRTV